MQETFSARWNFCHPVRHSYVINVNSLLKQMHHTIIQSSTRNIYQVTGASMVIHHLLKPVHGWNNNSGILEAVRMCNSRQLFTCPMVSKGSQNSLKYLNFSKSNNKPMWYMVKSEESCSLKASLKLIAHGNGNQLQWKNTRQSLRSYLTTQSFQKLQ